MMKKHILKFGFICGGIPAFFMNLLTIFSSKIGFDNSLIIGYTVLILSFCIIYFAILSYRNSLPERKITFWQGVKVGLGVSLITSICYVAVWLVVFYTIVPDYMENYGKYMVDKMKASGASDAKILETQTEMTKQSALLKNPLYNAAFTFLEPFPVGVLVTLVSAGIISLKKK